MANHFNMNDNKESLGGTEFSSTATNCGFSNDPMALNYNGVPDFSTTPTEITYTVTFNNADNNGGISTYTTVPFSTIGSAIEEKLNEEYFKFKREHGMINGKIGNKLYYNNTYSLKANYKNSTLALLKEQINMNKTQRLKEELEEKK